jgi:hypothetical protein
VVGEQTEAAAGLVARQGEQRLLGDVDGDEGRRPRPLELRRRHGEEVLGFVELVALPGDVGECQLGGDDAGMGGQGRLLRHGQRVGSQLLR